VPDRTSNELEGERISYSAYIEVAGRVSSRVTGIDSSVDSELYCSAWIEGFLAVHHGPFLPSPTPDRRTEADDSVNPNAEHREQHAIQPAFASASEPNAWEAPGYRGGNPACALRSKTPTFDR